MTNNNLPGGFSKVTTNNHTKRELFINSLAVWWRGKINEIKLRTLAANKEGRGSDLRGGQGLRR
jgi:hypothetical protein